MTISALAASGSFGEAVLVQAQQPQGSLPVQTGTLDLQLPIRRFDIAAGPLSEALSSFQQATGIHVVLHLPEGTIAGFRTNGISGEMRLDVALGALLADT